jgi:ABC-type uncharacterized transport system YnjBCD permease subunit
MKIILPFAFMQLFLLSLTMAVINILKNSVKRSWSILRYCHIICFEGLKKTTKPLIIGPQLPECQSRIIRI